MALDDAYPTSASTLSSMAQWEGLFTGLSADGVIPGAANELVPSLNTGARTAVLGTGSAQIRGFHVDNPSSTATPIPAADAQNRIDRLVLRLDRTAEAAEDWITPVVIEGTPSATPQIPALTQTTDGNYDIPIARWTSASNGSLTGLVDERQFAAASPVEFRSDARPSATIRRLGFERDTGKVLWANGTSWVLVYEDTGDVALSVTTPSRWEARSPGQYASRLNGVVHVEMNLKRIGEALQTDSSDASEGSALTQLPAGLRPKRELQIPVTLTAGISARIRYQTDGGVYLNAPSATVGVGRFVRFTHSFRGA